MEGRLLGVRHLRRVCATGKNDVAVRMGLGIPTSLPTHPHKPAIELSFLPPDMQPDTDKLGSEVALLLKRDGVSHRAGLTSVTN